jgi:PTS system mannose-specific IIC component
VIDNFAWLLLWGVLVGLDLASVAQVMIARPFVAAVIAGLIVGDPAMGMTVGVVLELFAFEVLPVGASKYPDYGLGAVSGVAAAAGAPAILGTGVGVAAGLLVAFVGGWAIHLMRIRNGGDVERHRTQLDAGSVAVIARLHVRCLGRDVIRCLLVTLFGLILAWAVRQWAPLNVQGAVYLGIVTLGAAASAAVMGVIRLAGQKSVPRWFVLGLIGGFIGVILL